MKKIFCMAFSLGIVAAGCVLTPAQPSASQTDVSVKIVGQKPQGCQFISGVIGAQNDASGQWSQQLLDNIRANAAALGGNVVYLRSARVAAPGASDEYFQDFYVDGVQYGALIYKCP